MSWTQPCTQCMDQRKIANAVAKTRYLQVQDKDRRLKLLTAKPAPASRKLCSRCAQEKGAEDFYKDASKPDGLQARRRCCCCCCSCGLCSDLAGPAPFNCRASRCDCHALVPSLGLYMPWMSI